MCAGERYVAPPGLAVSAVRLACAKALVVVMIAAAVTASILIGFIISSLIKKPSFSNLPVFHIYLLKVI
jgi:hypothetical protein